MPPSRRSSTTRSASTRSPTAPRCSARVATFAGGWNHVGEVAHGTKGTADPSGSIEGENAWKFTGESPNGHQQEQHDLIEALMRGEIYNEGEYGAQSTFTAILGREACYSGKVIKWDELLAKGRELALASTTTRSIHRHQRCRMRTDCIRFRFPASTTRSRNGQSLKSGVLVREPADQDAFLFAFAPHPMGWVRSVGKCTFKCGIARSSSPASPLPLLFKATHRFVLFDRRGYRCATRATCR